MPLWAVMENNLVCGSLLGAAAHVCRNVLRRRRLVGRVLVLEVCAVANGLADQATRPDILAGVDMTSVLFG